MTTGGLRDAYNFYNSHLRINIECAFGHLVARWGILRLAIPVNITIAKTTELVVALAKLHNFCIKESDAKAESMTNREAFICCKHASSSGTVGWWSSF
jgi:hypothetical protein